MKRSLLLVLVGISLVSLVFGACSQSTPTPTSAPPSVTKSAPPASTGASPTATTVAPPSTTAAPSSAAAKVIELNFNVQAPGPAQPGPYAGFEFFSKEVGKRSNGRLKVNVYYGSTLASPNTTFDAVVNGVADIGETLAGYSPGKFPVSEVLELPLGYPSSQVFAHVENDFFAKYQLAEYSKVVPLFFATTPPMVIGTTKKEVMKIDDLKGLTLRTAAGGGPMLQFLGATPKVATMPETYEMLSKGVVDGVLAALDAYPGFKLGDLVHYLFDVSAVAPGSVTFIVMNKDSWNKISTEDQKMIMQVSTETIDVRQKTVDQANGDALKAFLALQGRKINSPTADEVTKMKTLSKNTIDAWVSQKTAAGIPAAEYMKFIQDRMAYWTAQIAAK